MFTANEILSKAISSKDKTVIETILNSITDFNTDIENVHNIISDLWDIREIEMIKLLFTKNIPSDCKNHALINAVYNNKIKLIQFLLDNGADVNCMINNYSPLLIIVIEDYNNDSSNIIKLLLEKGADITLANKDGNNSLMRACCRSHGHYIIENVQLLLSKEIGINCQNNNGFTALMFAAQCGNFDIIKLLLAKGADATLKNKNGRTARDLTTSLRCQRVLIPVSPVELPYYGLCSTKPRDNFGYPGMKKIQKDDEYYYVFSLKLIKDKNHQMPTKSQRCLSYFVDEDSIEGIFWL